MNRRRLIRSPRQDRIDRTIHSPWNGIDRPSSQRAHLRPIILVSMSRSLNELTRRSIHIVQLRNIVHVERASQRLIIACITMFSRVWLIFGVGHRARRLPITPRSSIVSRSCRVGAWRGVAVWFEGFFERSCCKYMRDRYPWRLVLAIVSWE